MPSAELIAHVRTVFEEQEQRNGQTNHRDVAIALLGQQSSLVPHLSREVLRMPTRQHLYEGAEDTLRQLLEQSGEQDRIVIWTQGNPTGQLWKVGMSGLGSLRRTYGRERFSIHAAENKIETLPGLLDKLTTSGSDRVVIVDDKAKNIANVAAVAAAWQQIHPENPVKIVPVWINQGRTKNQVPQGTTLEEFTATYHTITDIRELQALHTEGQRTTWLIDWDHTLNETEHAKERLFHNIATRIEITHPDPVLGSHIIDLQSHIVGAYTIVDLQNGMSGRRVIEAKHEDASVVVKHAPDNAKTQAEIHGLTFLQQMPHAAHMPLVHFISEKHGVIAMEKVSGNSGREKLQTGLLTREDVARVDGVINMKLQWLRAVRAGGPIPANMKDRSMQREEFEDTRRGIQDAVQILSTSVGIPVERLLKQQTYYDDRLHVSLSEVVQKVSSFYAESSNDQRFPLHGDVSWGNMIFSDDRVHIIDGEWTGLHDPAEAYARIAKVISTTTAPVRSLRGGIMSGIVDSKTVLAIDVNDPFSSQIHDAQQHLLDRGEEFASATQDAFFMRKLYMYLAGSYLRELAIANRRGMGPNEQIFALKKAIDMVELAQAI